MKILSLVRELLYVERQGQKEELNGILVNPLQGKPILPKELNFSFIFSGRSVQFVNNKAMTQKPIPTIR
jgi:hypothetical protein